LTPLARHSNSTGGPSPIPASCHPSPGGPFLPSITLPMLPVEQAPAAFGPHGHGLGVKYGFISKRTPPANRRSPCSRFQQQLYQRLGVGGVVQLPIWVENGVRTLEPRSEVWIHRRPANPVSQLLYGDIRQEGSRKKLELSAEVFSHAAKASLPLKTQSRR